MNKPFIARAEVTVDASAAKVWEALTTPELMKHYLFGTTVTTDWCVGSPITYAGEWEGKKYEDKGKILKMVPEKLFRSTYWSSLGGREDKPEHYATVSYELEETNGQTRVVVIQDNNPTEEAKNHSAKNWLMVLGKLKDLVEQ